MISLTRENDVTVRLDADYNVKHEIATYIVDYDGVRFYFSDFKRAAILYKSLCAELKMGCDMKMRIAGLAGLYGKDGTMTKLLGSEVA